jgi:hypothetical protein
MYRRDHFPFGIHSGLLEPRGARTVRKAPSCAEAERATARRRLSGMIRLTNEAAHAAA